MKVLSRLLRSLPAPLPVGRSRSPSRAGHDHALGDDDVVVQPSGSPALPTSFSNGRVQTINQL